MKTEQEFFEAFGIEPKQEFNCVFCQYYDDAEIDTGCSHYLADECEEIEFIYPEITPEIVLKLEEIAMNAIWVYGGDRLIYTNENGLHKYFADNYSDKVLLKADTKKEALLKLFLHDYAIRKEDVQDQVRGIFNE